MLRAQCRPGLPLYKDERNEQAEEERDVLGFLPQPLGRNKSVYIFWCAPPPKKEERVRLSDYFFKFTDPSFRRLERPLSDDLGTLRILDNAGSQLCNIASYHPHSVCSSSSSLPDAV